MEWMDESRKTVSLPQRSVTYVCASVYMHVFMRMEWMTSEKQLIWTYVCASVCIYVCIRVQIYEWSWMDDIRKNS